MKKINIYTADFETVIVKNKHYVTCYSIVGKDFNCVKSIKIGEKIEIASHNLLSSFIYDCFLLSKDNSSSLENHYYFHNLSRFDSNFILEFCSKYKEYSIDIISRDNVRYSIKIKYQKEYLLFKDSYLICPLSLKSIGLNLCNNNKKIDFNHNNDLINYNDENFVNSIHNYCLNDSMVLFEGLNNFFSYIYENMGVDVKKCLTLASISHNIYNEKYSDNSINFVYNNMESFIRQSYKCGSVEVYKPNLSGGFHYDVNSLYPFVMCENNFPVGDGEWVDGENIDINNFFGFLNCEVECEKNIKKPFLSINTKNGLISPVGYWEDVYFSEEIKYALSLKYYKIKIKKGIIFNKKNIFNEFINKLYSMRLTFNKSHPMNTIIKLILNSFYGKFGMRELIKKTGVLNNDYEVFNYQYKHTVQSNTIINEKIIVDYIDKPNISNLKKFKNDNLISDSEYYNTLEKLINLNIKGKVHIASAVTAYARIYMHKFKSNFDIYYSDTDSLFSYEMLNEKYVSSTKLGLFKLEGVVNEAIFVAPKVYYVEYADGSVVKKFKGLKNEMIDKNDYIKLYRNEIVFKNIVNFFVVNYKSFEINIRKSLFKFTGISKKFEKEYDNNIWISCKPIVLDKNIKSKMRDILKSFIKPFIEDYLDN